MKKHMSIFIPTMSVILSVAILRCVIFIGYVPSESMEPTIKAGSIILGTRLYNNLHTNDIIVFRHDGKVLVKRIAAEPYESITINGKQYTVPSDSYFMLGDNRDNSYDSRYWDEPFVNNSMLIAKVWSAKGTTCNHKSSQ